MTLIAALISLGASLVVAIVTAYLTVRLALRRFYSEKWWERKSEAYTAIIESMHHIREHADEHLAHMDKTLKIPPEGEQMLDSNLQKAMADLRRHRDIGSFVVSADAIEVLNALFKDLDESVQIGHQRSWWEYLDHRVGAVDRSLSDMRRVARKDLSLT